GQGAALLGHVGDFAGLDVREEPRIADVLGRVGGIDPGEEERRGTHDEEQHDDAVPEELRIQEGASGVTTGDARVSPSNEYSAGVRDDPMTVVLSPTCPYGRGGSSDGDGRRDEGFETTTRAT